MYDNAEIVMYDNDEITLASLGTLSIHRLAEFAMEEELIDGFYFLSEEATITQGDRRFVLPHRQACTFLIGMLRGRSWYLDDPSQGVHDSADDEPTPGDDHPAGTGRDLESTLDALLTFTRDVGIIQGYEKDIDDRTVRIDISACSLSMSFADTLGYLLDCVQHEMRSMTAAV